MSLIILLVYLQDEIVFGNKKKLNDAMSYSFSRGAGTILSM